MTILVIIASNAATAADSATVMQAALKLKQDAIQLTLKNCKAAGGTNSRCNDLLEAIHRRELQVTARLAPALADTAINQDELGHENAACYAPGYGYEQLVECQSQLADRVDAARKGQSLLRSADVATGATANLWVLIFLSTGPVPGVADHAGIAVFAGVFASEASCLHAAKLWRDQGLTNIDCVQNEVKP